MTYATEFCDLHRAAELARKRYDAARARLRRWDRVFWHCDRLTGWCRPLYLVLDRGHSRAVHDCHLAGDALKRAVAALRAAGYEMTAERFERGERA